MVLDWRPSVPWVGIEDCQCDAFFVWGLLLDNDRLDILSQDECTRIRERIIELRTAQREAWLYTADGTPQGPLVVRMERPR